MYVVHYNYSDELSIRIFRSAMKVRRGEKPPLICFEVLFAQKIAFLMHFLRLLEFGNNNKCTNQQSNSVFLEWVFKKFLEAYNPHKWASLNYVGRRGGRGVSQMPMLLHKLM